MQQYPSEVLHFRELEPIGEGSMAKVFRAVDSGLDRLVALKFPKTTPQEAEGLDRFKREARAIGRLEHDGVCPVYGIYTHQGSPFLAMKYLPGGNYRQRIQGNTDSTTLEIALEFFTLAQTLEYVHSAGVVHRDLKPENILLDTTGERLLVSDFGLAIDNTQESFTRTGEIIGTVAYMSPEQLLFKSSEIQAATDVYSLGVILYERITGSRPFEGVAADIIIKVRRDRPNLPSELKADVHPQLEVLCLAMMEKVAENRPSAKVVREKLAQFLWGNERIQHPHTIMDLIRSAAKSPAQYSGAIKKLSTSQVDDTLRELATAFRHAEAKFGAMSKQADKALNASLPTKLKLLQKLSALDFKRRKQLI